jgi:hypothetical protein
MTILNVELKEDLIRNGIAKNVSIGYDPGYGGFSVSVLFLNDVEKTYTNLTNEDIMTLKEEFLPKLLTE